MNKTILITGASQGIGFALARLFVESGYKVIGTNRTGLIPTLSYDNFEVLPLDLSNDSSISELVLLIKKRAVDIDLLINNAGIGPDLGTLEPNEKTFKMTFDVNVIGTTFLTESIIPYIKKGGKIINISSKMGSINTCSSADSIAYRMSKTALNMYSKILTNRLKGLQSIAAVHPGWVRTNISKDSSLNGRLLPVESARRIFNFVKTNFRSGIFYDVESQSALDW